MRKHSNHGTDILTIPKKVLTFGDDGLDYIEGILSREETEDVISMMINADKTLDCLQLPGFFTSSQTVRGDNARWMATPSFSSLPSPILLNDHRGNRSSVANGEIVANVITKFSPNKMDLENNYRNVNSSLGNCEQKSGQDFQIGVSSDPGAQTVAKNSAETDETRHDPDRGEGRDLVLVQVADVADDTVATYVVKENNVTTASVLVTDCDSDETEVGDLGSGEAKPVGTAGGSNSLNPPGEGENGAVRGANDGDKSDAGLLKGGEPSQLDTIAAKMDLVEEIISMMDEKSNKMVSTVRDLEASLEYSQNEIETLKKENEELKRLMGVIENEDKRTQFQVNMIEDKMDKLETPVKRKNLIFEGIPEVEGKREETEKTIGDLFDQLAVGKGINFENCYRVGSYIKGRSRPILVSFERQADRDLLFAKRMELKHTTHYQRVWVNEVLGPASKRKRGLIRLIAKEASLQGIDHRTGKYAIHIDKVKYDCSNLDELPPNLHPTQLKQVQVNDTTLAYQSEHAPFSNFFACPIKLGKHTFFCVEQAFHFIRAKNLNKHLAATKIYLSRDVRFIKQTGSELGTSTDWEAKQFDVMYACIKKKFEQNKDLRELLLKSGNLELVEATPDPLWGCGATLSSNVIRRKEWRGRNKQGEILMVVREELIQRRQETPNLQPQ